MASNIGCAGHKSLVCAPEVTNIMSLQDQHDDPVNAGYDRVQAERCAPMAILSPYRMAEMLVSAVGWSREGVVRAKYDQEKPGKNGEDFVRDEIVLGELFSFGEWIPYPEIRVLSIQYKGRAPTVRHLVGCSVSLLESSALPMSRINVFVLQVKREAWTSGERGVYRVEDEGRHRVMRRKRGAEILPSCCLGQDCSRDCSSFFSETDAASETQD